MTPYGIGASLLALILGGGMVYALAAHDVRAVDGDTVALGSERVRLVGIACPELKQPGGLTAKLALQSMLQGEIRVERLGKDRYGRTVGRLYANGQDLSCKLIQSGHCRRWAKFDPEGGYKDCHKAP